MGLATVLTILMLGSTMAEAAGVLTIGRREDSTTFDPIKSAQNVDNWVFSNVFDVLVRVDKTGTKLEPGLAESWTISEDGLTYTFKMRDAKFSDGSPITAADAAFSLLRIRDNEGSLWSDSYKVVASAEAHGRQDARRQAEGAVCTVPVDTCTSERFDPVEEGP
jgi:peptide/nickel transport system substrate-binding protein